MLRLAECDKNLEFPFSNEDAGRLIDEYLAARKRGDKEEARRIIKMFPMSPSVARALKIVKGTEYLRNCGRDLSEANKAFGDDWLD